MILVTTEGIPGKELEVLGLVKGSTIQTVNIARDIGASLKTLVGGELVRGHLRPREWSRKPGSSARMPSSVSATAQPPSRRVPRKSWLTALRLNLRTECQFPST